MTSLERAADDLDQFYAWLFINQHGGVCQVCGFKVDYQQVHSMRLHFRESHGVSG
jgi:hypothetical protein